MRPTIEGVEHRAVDELRQALPELEDRYDELVEIYEDDLGADVVFGALADLVNDVVLGKEGDEALLDRGLDFIESLAETGDADVDEIVGFCFLDQLSPGTLARVTSRLGGRTLEVLDRLERGDLGDPEGP
ncbi:MAG TPA: hypothetical protein VH112_12510 [Acidimicrobiales bacterium]|nr:hypothetical protein [Acidimicrobiales bacterium]